MLGYLGAVGEGDFAHIAGTATIHEHSGKELRSSTILAQRFPGGFRAASDGDVTMDGCHGLFLIPCQLTMQSMTGDSLAAGPLPCLGKIAIRASCSKGIILC